MKNENIIIDFFLVGAARCGTTTLYNYLNNSDALFLPLVKEPNFFSNVDSPKTEDFENPKPGEKYHAKIIDDIKIYNALYANANTSQLKGDTSPSYIWDTTVAKKLYNHNPKSRILISLRHPVDRAYSHYIMNYYTGTDNSKTFDEALKAEKNPVWGSCNEYLEMGFYYHQVKSYYDIFPKEQIKVLVYEDWIKNISNTIEEIFSFLEIEFCDSVLKEPVESNKITPVKKKALLNVLRQNKIKGTIKRLINQDRIDALKSYFFNDDSKEIEKIDLELRKELSTKFSEDITKLSKLTGIDFSSKWE